MSEVMTRPAAGWERIRGDIAGGFSAAIIALPLALGFGVACFAPLGPDYTGSDQWTDRADGGGDDRDPGGSHHPGRPRR